MLDGKGYQNSGGERTRRTAVATGTRRRNSLTRLIEDVVDDAKDLVDDVVDRAKDVERDGRKAVRRTVSDNGDRADRSPEMDDLRSALDDLTARVNRLVALQ